MESLKTNHGAIQLPAFLPDATYGSIRSASFKDVKNSGINEIVSTTLHLEQKIGSTYIKNFGGIHKFFGWDRPVLTDSGGWQVFSLINSQNKKSSISEVGCTFVNPDTGLTSLLTPESSINIQTNLGADIMTVLDDPIIGDASLAERKKSVEFTTKWAKRSKNQFNLKKDAGEINDKVLLGAVIQGADDFENRRISAEKLQEIGFDLYNFGGIPTYPGVTWRNNDKKGFYREMLSFVSELLPQDKIKYAMGIGQPDDIAYCVNHGWNIFDTVLPTRNARHGYLYVTKGNGDMTKGWGKYMYDIIHIRTDRYTFDDGPIDPNLMHPETQNVSRAYLRHLIRIKEPAGFRIATIHNLHFYAKWMERLRQEVETGKFDVTS